MSGQHPHARNYWSTHTPSNAGVGPLLRELHIPWPEANEDTLRSAASAWNDLADAINDASGLANSNAKSLTSNNQGAAMDEFEKYWSQYVGPNGALTVAASTCTTMSAACTNYADAVTTAKSNIEDAGAAIAATLIFGTLGAFFTFGASEGVADSVAAGLLVTVTGFMDTLVSAAAGIASGLSVTLEADILGAGSVMDSVLTSGIPASLLSSAISGGAVGVGGTITSTVADADIRALYGDAPASRSDMLQDLLVGGLAGGATGGLLEEAGDMTSEQLANLLRNTADSVQDSDPQQYVELVALANKLQGMTGKLTNGVFASVASQLLTAQQTAAQDVASDQLQSLLENAAGK
jgi:hypothetical protein